MQRVSLHHIARVIEVAIGAYFLVSAISKALDIDKFLVQMAAYKVLPSSAMLAPSALFVLSVEVALGVALVLGLRLRGLTYLLLQVMLVGFTGLIVYAWRVHGIEDCGCFPLVRMSPPVSIVKNILLCGAGLFAWWRLLVCAAPRAGPVVNARKLLWAAVALVLGGLTSAYAWYDMEESSVKYDESGEVVAFSQFVLDADSGHYDLGTGVYLVPILSMSCAECMEKVDILNELAINPAMPPMIALCYEDTPGDLDTFRAFTMPTFPLYNLGNRAMLFYSLRGDSPFRLSLARDGRQIHAWDGRVPDAQEVLDAMAAP